MEDKAEKIAEKARESISRYCIEECKAYCCRKGYLPLNEDEVDLVTQGKRKELEDKGLLRKTVKERHSLNMGVYSTPCPSLDMNKFTCTIHTNPKRPKCCRDFPLFLENNLVKLSPRCPAVKENLFYPYVKQLLMLGYKLAENSQFADLELYKVEIAT